MPAGINRRLSNISANEDVFQSSLTPYKDALKKSGHDFNLKYEEGPGRGRQRRGRKITWFNPPFSANVSTDIGAKFLRIIDTCFPKDHILHKIINRNTVKISYRCMPNMQQVISMQNSKILKQKDQPDPPPRCSCRGGINSCPLGGGCEIKEVVYCAQVTRLDNNTTEFYTGLTGGSFKKRYNQHHSDFRNQSKEHKTCLSKHVWKHKRENVPFRVDWKILSRGKVFNPVTKKCQLCLKEKFLIMFSPETATLNARTEMYNTCRHRLTKLLKNSKT